MMRTAFLIAILVAVAFAEAPIRPMIKETCTGDNYKWIGESGLYSNGSQSAICIFVAYEEKCTGIQGLTACDLYDQVCVQYSGEETWKAEAKASGRYVSNMRPWKCVREGAFWFPDSGVVAVAQVIVTSAFIIWAALVTLMSCKAKIHIVATAALLLMLPVSIILAHSYYYLNAIIVVAGTIGAIGLFSEKSAVFGATGMIVGLVTLFWVTYDAGLGFVQHHSRRMAGTAAQDTYENGCNNYYRGYFEATPVRLGDDENPLVKYGGYCSRSLLAGMLFVMIFLELLLVLAIAVGAFQPGIQQTVEAPVEAPAVEAPAVAAPAVASS